MKNDTKQLIMTTAWKHFSRYGYTDTNLKDICKDAGITKGPLYYYFKDKEDLYNQVIAEEILNIRKRYEDIFSADTDIMTILQKDMELCTTHNPLQVQTQQLDESSPVGGIIRETSQYIYDIKKQAFEKFKSAGRLKENSDITEMVTTHLSQLK